MTCYLNEQVCWKQCRQCLDDADLEKSLCREGGAAAGGGQQQLRWKRSSAHMLGGAAGGSRRQHTWQAGDVLAHGKKGRVGVQLLSGACCNNLSEVGSSRQRQQQQQNEQETKTSRRTLPKLRTAHAVPIAFFNYFQQFSLSLSHAWLPAVTCLCCTHRAVAVSVSVLCNHAIMLPTSELLMPIGVNVRTTSAFALRRIHLAGA